jgi:hypothetical protein
VQGSAEKNEPKNGENGPMLRYKEEKKKAKKKKGGKKK